MRPLLAVLAVQLVLGAALIVVVATGNIPFVGGAASGDADGSAAVRFDGRAAWGWLRVELSYGPRPAGSAASRRLAERLRRALPRGRFQAVPGGLRNVIGTVPGRDRRRYLVVGAHYDTKDIPGFVGANDGGAGTAAVVELARELRPRTIGPTVVFALFDGEETPAGIPDSQFLDRGDRGSAVAARAYHDARAMILLDFVANRGLSIPREATSDRALWAKLRSAARSAGVLDRFPPASAAGVLDDHTPFEHQGIPSIDLIDWRFPCFHRLCDNLAAVSEAGLAASGRAVATLLPTL